MAGGSANRANRTDRLSDLIMCAGPPSSMTSEPNVTQLLVAWGNGDQAAFDRLAPAVHQHLHRLAAHYMAGERPGHVLQTTALVNEAYVRLVDWKGVQWQNRAHFFGVAAQAMRHILVDAARNAAPGETGRRRAQCLTFGRRGPRHREERRSGGPGRCADDAGDVEPAP